MQLWILQQDGAFFVDQSKALSKAALISSLKSSYLVDHQDDYRDWAQNLNKQTFDSCSNPANPGDIFYYENKGLFRLSTMANIWWIKFTEYARQKDYRFNNQVFLQRSSGVIRRAVGFACTSSTAFLVFAFKLTSKNVMRSCFECIPVKEVLFNLFLIKMLNFSKYEKQGLTKVILDSSGGLVIKSSFCYWKADPVSFIFRTGWARAALECAQLVAGA